MEIKVIRFLAQKHPEMTHFNQCKTLLMLQLPKGTQKLVIEHIFPKMMSKQIQRAHEDGHTCNLCMQDECKSG
jgi:hypothetical protein